MEKNDRKNIKLVYKTNGLATTGDLYFVDADGNEYSFDGVTAATIVTDMSKDIISHLKLDIPILDCSCKIYFNTDTLGDEMRAMNKRIEDREKDCKCGGNCKH